MAKETLDSDLIEGLKQAKKSPRNFALIAKGVTPLRLLVQKKKFRDGELMKAKTEAKGNDIIVGVLVANGSDFAFQVLGEEPTIKPIKLKELIEEQTEMTSKPRWEVVTALQEIGGDEEGAVVEGQEAPSLAPPPGPPPVVDTQAALGAWQAARAEVIARLREVGKEVAAANHPESAQALIELKAVIANLTEKPESPQQVKELRSYLGDDDVVLDVCELAFDLRTPLLAALDGLQPTTSA
jgi:hypothetical protein